MRLMVLRLALLGIALAAASPAIARSAEYKWTSGPRVGGTTIVATIKNAAGSVFRISCDSRGIEYETKRTALREDERVQIVVARKSFVLISGPSMAARGNRISLAGLVREM